jgi:hypothetical protein
MLQVTSDDIGGDSVRPPLRHTFSSSTSPLVAIVAVTVVLSMILIMRAAPAGELGSIVFASSALAFGIAAWTAAGRERPEVRLGALIYLLGLSLRLGSSAIFQMRGAARGDVFFGTPDAVMYDNWARFLAAEWRSGNLPTINEYYNAGTWEVGFHHLLGFTYLLFGDSVLAGRVLVAFFGAMAAVALYGVARRLTGEVTAASVGLLYAFWPVSVGWSSVSLLRDSLVWFLTLAAIWLVMRMGERHYFDAVPLLAVLVLLRYVRTYALYFVLAGLVLASVLTLVRRRRDLLKPALIILLTVVSSEAFFATIGYPSAADFVFRYEAERWVLKPIPESDAVAVGIGSPASGVGASSAPSESGTSPDPNPGFAPTIESGGAAADTKTEATPARGPTLLPPVTSSMDNPPVAYAGEGPANKSDDAAAAEAAPMLFGNIVRGVLAPFAWTGDIDAPGNWQLPGMWLWYLTLPVAMLGFLATLRRPSAFTVIACCALVYFAAVVLIGRGDAGRQREAVVPFVILAGAIGFHWGMRHRRLLIAAYVAWSVLLVTAMVYHRHSLRERGMIGDTGAASESLKGVQRCCPVFGGRELSCETSDRAPEGARTS